MKQILSIALVAAMSAGLCFSSCAQKNNTPEQPKPINVIYMIGDGMSLPQVYGTMVATGNDLVFSQFPYTGVVQTHSANRGITDSAASGTALACGKKTNNGMLGMDADTVAMESILDELAQQGKETGIVVSCYATHATPAAFYAKVPKRSMYEEIAVQMAESERLNLMIGGGRKFFNQRKDSVNLLERMENELGWKVYDTLADIDVTCKKYAVIAADDHMPRAAERGDFLPRGVQTALETLDNAENGFFLMVEGSLIDMACHDNDSTYMVGEVVDFSNAVQVALDYAKTHENTLLVVTADHETGGLSLHDPEGHYEHVAFDYATGGHSCLPVIVYAYGPGAENFTGWMQNSDLKGKIMKSLGYEPSETDITTEE